MAIIASSTSAGPVGCSDQLRLQYRGDERGSPAWQVAVSAETDSFQVTPGPGAVPASLSVETDRRAYSFLLETGDGLQAAYVVRLRYGPALERNAIQTVSSPSTIPDRDWTYRLRGDRSVRPALIRDNGAKTVIEYAPGQALPAVFSIGPTGEEEVVDGYSREDGNLTTRLLA